MCFPRKEITQVSISLSLSSFPLCDTQRGISPLCQSLWLCSTQSNSCAKSIHTLSVGRGTSGVDLRVYESPLLAQVMISQKVYQKRQLWSFRWVLTRFYYTALLLRLIVIFLIIRNQSRVCSYMCALLSVLATSWWIFFNMWAGWMHVDPLETLVKCRTNRS